MKTNLDIVATSGLWLRLLGAACTEMVKHYATEECPEQLCIWAWDTDPRGVDWLVPEPLHLATTCHDAEERARDLAAHGAPSVEALRNSIKESIGGLHHERPVLSLATLTSKSTFEDTLNLLAHIERDILLIALADFPQDPSMIKELPKRVDAGHDLLMRAVETNPRLAPIVLSRGAFTSGTETMGDTAKQSFMACLQHVLWLILTHDNPVSLVRAWHEKIRNEPSADWALGHVQLDCGKPKEAHDQVRGHTWFGGQQPYCRGGDWKTVRITGYNHLGFREHAGSCQAMAADVFREQGKSPIVKIDGVEPINHDTWLVERVDVVLLNKVVCDQSAPLDSGDTSVA